MLCRKHTNIRSLLGELNNSRSFVPLLLAMVSIWILREPLELAGRFGIPLGIAVPLYSSFSKEGILENINRQIILKLVQKRPGITFTELKQDLNLQNGVLAYHLSILQKNHYIKSFSDGKFKRFYVRGTKISGLTTVEEHIIAVIESHPNISRRSIAQLIDCSQGTVNMNLKNLLKKELIDVRKEGKHFAYILRP